MAPIQPPYLTFLKISGWLIFKHNPLKCSDKEVTEECHANDTRSIRSQNPKTKGEMLIKFYFPKFQLIKMSPLDKKPQIPDNKLNYSLEVNILK